MSLRLEMLQVARLAPRLLGDSSELVRAFILSQQNEEGGFKDRTGGSDLYYTVFGLDALTALGPVQNEEAVRERFERARKWLEPFGSGDGLDFVHLCCLIRSRAAVGFALKLPPPTDGSQSARALEAFRSEDGGYNSQPGSQSGTAYGAFLALGAYGDLGLNLPDPLRLVQSLKFLETADGGWANERSQSHGSTNATAAAVTVLRNLHMPINPSAGQWLLAQAHLKGGFLAAPNAPIPDLLSTATALHALGGLEVSFAPIKEACLDFVDSLWTNTGGFHGHWADDELDCEYTFYGLLALGHLAV